MRSVRRSSLTPGPSGSHRRRPGHTLPSQREGGCNHGRLIMMSTTCSTGGASCRPWVDRKALGDWGWLSIDWALPEQGGASLDSSPQAPSSARSVRLMKSSFLFGPFRGGGTRSANAAKALRQSVSMVAPAQSRQGVSSRSACAPMAIRTRGDPTIRSRRRTSPTCERARRSVAQHRSAAHLCIWGSPRGAQGPLKSICSSAIRAGQAPAHGSRRPCIRCRDIGRGALAASSASTPAPGSGGRTPPSRSRPSRGRRSARVPGSP
jgi:hypothetical protein